MFRAAARLITLSLALLGLLVGAPVVRSQSMQWGNSNELTGAWWVNVTVYDCITKAPKSKFSSLLLFSRGGTLTEVTANPGFLPGQRSTGIGTWSIDAQGMYSASDTAFLLFSGGPFVQGTQSLTHRIKMNADGTFSDAAKIQFYDASGNALLPKPGCASAMGRRLSTTL